MSQPNVYIIQKAFLEKNPESQLPGSYKIATTVGLIEYEVKGDKKYMVIDSCQVVNWPTIEQEILKIAGGFDKITHLLLTHTHMDHIQNIAKFEGKILFLANKASIIGEHEYGSQEIYSNGFIEIPEIQYEIVNDAHSHDDTIYIIDSANEGKVAFLGDLIYSSLDKMSIEVLINMEKRASIDPVKKFLYVKDFYKQHQDITKIFLGHDDLPISYPELGNYLEALDNSKEWQDYLEEYIRAKESEIKNYRDRL